MISGVFTMLSNNETAAFLDSLQKTGIKRALPGLST